MPLPYVESLVPQNGGGEGGWRTTAQELSKCYQEASVREEAP